MTKYDENWILKVGQCVICGEELAEGTRVCTLCGSTQPETSVPTATAVVAPAPPLKVQTLAHSVPKGGRVCPSCGAAYSPDFRDAFCTCGVELVLPSALPVPDQVPLPAAPSRPAPGTPCLVLYGPDKQPAQYFSLTKDAVLIGRLDAVAGVFPEIDVMQWLDASAARKVSRLHALILRSRTSGAFSIRPLAGNTGTQIEADMVPPLHDFPLKPGTRLILGGAVRFKFEIA